MHLTLEGTTLTDIDIKNKDKRNKEVNKDSNRIIKDYDNNNNKDNIFIHMAEKCAFYKSLEQKQKPKKPHLGNIEYNVIEICTIVRCFAFKYFLLTHRQNFSLVLSNCFRQHLEHNYCLKYVSGRLGQMLEFAL